MKRRDRSLLHVSCLHVSRFSPESMNASIHVERFLRSVHRRLVIVRALERGGACAAVACLFAAALSAIQLGRGENALAPATMILALGGAIGIGWGLAVRPRLL